jgi:hypothetical protein
MHSISAGAICLQGILMSCSISLAAEDQASQLAREIDSFIGLRLSAEGLQPAVQASDGEFLRRVTLDLHGTIPTLEFATEFFSNQEEGKRGDLVDALLSSPKFGQHFGNLWRSRLLSPLMNEQRQQSEKFQDWLAKRFNENEGWDRITSELLTASGKLEDNPAVTYLIEGRNPLGVTDLTDLVSHYFLGIRLNCAQCHDHPFADWKRQDYWGMAAFFTEIQTPNRPKMVYMAGVQDNPMLTLKTLAGADMLEGYIDRPPTFLGGKELATQPQSARIALANWMTAPENPYFARAAVNRLWWHFLGRGLVDPVDDMHLGNAPSHPELLEMLSQRFIESGYDLKLLCRAIANTRTYQQTSRPALLGEVEEKWFARMPIKVLSADQLYDSLVVILGPPAKSKGIDTRLGARFEFTQFFSSDGDPDPMRYDRGIPHALRLMNSSQFTGRSLDMFVSRIATGRSSEQIINELFISILSRPPNLSEVEFSQAHVRSSGEMPHAAFRELAWSLLLSSEFSLNH